MSINIVPLIYDGFEVKIKMSDGNNLKLHQSDLPDKLRLDLEKKCIEVFEVHYDEMIIKHKGEA